MTRRASEEPEWPRKGNGQDNTRHSPNHISTTTATSSTLGIPAPVFHRFPRLPGVDIASSGDFNDDGGGHFTNNNDHTLIKATEEDTLSAEGESAPWIHQAGQPPQQSRDREQAHQPSREASAGGEEPVSARQLLRTLRDARRQTHSGSSSASRFPPLPGNTHQ